MKIALLGWGSLLWDGGADFDQHHEVWQSDGPSLQLEFSRISKTRLGALTLVVDPNHGVPVTVAWCLSKRSKAEDAACDLRCREGTTIGNIAQLAVPKEAPKDAAAGSEPPEDPTLAWAKKKKLDVVIWTALESNFAKIKSEQFSVPNAVRHLQALTPEGKVKAAEYVWRAPAFVSTPLRQALQQEPWFSQQGR
jgi:hypothetical protein